MNYLLKCLFLSCLLISVVACTDGINETVISAYQLPVLPEPSYKFSRNGESSVNVLECGFLKSPIDRIFSEYMNEARMSTKRDYDEALRIYHEGNFGLKPQKEVSASSKHLKDRDKILKDIDAWFETSARIAGLGANIPSYEHRNREAVKGLTGYVGNGIGDKDICYVDERGIAVAEVYKYAIMGAIYLDKILNIHLSEQILENNEVLVRNDLTQLLPGHNYTELEHHWDLAYGYYDFWKTLAQSDGLPALKDCHLRISRSFVKGRALMTTSQYDEMRLQADTIRQELSRVVAVRAMHLLVGPNTLANLKENPRRAFRLLSQAYGLIYAAQFARNMQGKSFLTHEETGILLHELEKGDGLWDQERLLGREQTEGALYNLAVRIGEKFDVSPEDIKK